MKAMFGVVSLLVALGIVGLLAVRQLNAVGHADAGAASAASTSDGAPAVPAVPAMASSGTVREQAVQLQNKVAADAVKAMNDGAAGRNEAADK